MGTLEEIVKRLDADSEDMRSLAQVLDKTGPFAQAVERLHIRLHFLHQMFVLNSPKVKEHSCILCDLAVGTTTEPGIVPVLINQFEASMAVAIDAVRTVAVDALTDDALTRS